MSEIITLTQHVNASRERVWDAFTTVEGLAVWFWPMSPDTTYKVDLREGGHYEFRSESLDIGVQGQFHTIEHAQALNLTWLWDGSVDPDAVRVEFEPAGADGDPEAGGTLVTVKHALKDAADRGPITQGWTDCLTRLGEITDQTSFPAYTPVPVAPAQPQTISENARP